MFTSDKQRSLQKNILAQLCFSLFCAFFGAVYEYFSHEVYSYFMIYAFAVPLVLTVLPLLLVLLRRRHLPDAAALCLWNYGTATLTIGCLFRGVLDIYGTTNRLAMVYPAAAAVLLGAAVLVQLRSRGKTPAQPGEYIAACSRATAAKRTAG